MNLHFFLTFQVFLKHIDLAQTKKNDMKNIYFNLLETFTSDKWRSIATSSSVTSCLAPCSCYFIEVLNVRGKLVPIWAAWGRRKGLRVLITSLIRSTSCW